MNGRWRIASSLLGTALFLGAGGAVIKAAGYSTRFDAELQRLRAEWRAAQAAEGLSPVGRSRAALYAKYSTPQITLCKPVVLKPGASASLSVGGQFRPDTTFLVEDDRVTAASPTVSTTKFGATLTAAADALPTFVRLFAYTPVSGAYASCGAAVVAATPRFDLKASNGWTVTLTPDAKGWTVDGTDATLVYKAEYFKPDETKAFETITGSLRMSGDSAPASELRFSLSPSAGDAMAEYQALTAKMSDPQAYMRMSPREQEAFMKQLERVSERMAKEMESQLSNPAVMLEKQASFGCEDIVLKVDGGDVSGWVSCGEKVGRLTFSGARL